ncbi:MAG: tyrosine-protein phosphatase [Gaiella sp.]
MTLRGFVDVHSHVVPSLDDGARSIEEGLALCRLAVETGTRVLFATPHAHAEWGTYPLTKRRLATYDESLPVLREQAAAIGLDLRRGCEVYPTVLRASDPHDFVLGGTRGVLVECPGWWVDQRTAVEDTESACRAIVEAGLVPVVAHPERSPAFAGDLHTARRFAREGWLLCLNGSSLTGDDGGEAEGSAWAMLEDGIVSLVASDGHRAHRPPTLDKAFEAVAERCGEEAAAPLFCGDALPWIAPSAAFRPS